MRRPSLMLSAVLGGLTALPLMALLYLGERLAGLPFVPFDLFDWLTRVLPGGVITLGIDAIVSAIATLKLGETSSTAKHVEQAIAVGQMVGIGLLFGAIIAVIARRRRARGWQAGAIAGALLFLLVTAVELNLALGVASRPAALLWLAVLFVGWGCVLGGVLTRADLRTARASMTDTDRVSRRAVLAKLAAGSLGLAGAGWGLGSVLSAQDTTQGAGQPLTKLMPAASNAAAAVTATAAPAPTLPNAARVATTPDAVSAATSSAEPAATAPTTGGPAAASTTAVARANPVAPELAVHAPAPGTRPAVTPNQRFYRIDINTRPPRVDGTAWRLEVAGLFANARPLTISQLMAYPAITQPITVGCISNQVGGDLISTSNWTGARLRDVLQDLGLKPEARELAIQAADGFYESVPRQELLDPRTLLVYGMNGQTLPMEHGYPLRIYIPNHYGMKQPKWITRIKAIDHAGKGYWVDRGWNKEAHPQIQSIIDTVAQEKVVNGRVPVGGIAWAGDRGIRKVEVQVDGGTWTQATLLTPPPGPLTWVLWRYDWPRQPGQHTFRVRATDGTAKLQIEQPSDPHPNGATGYHAVSVTIA